MANFLVNLGWNAVKPLLKKWLGERGLRLPSAEVKLIAAKARLTEEQVILVDELIIASTLEELDKFKP